MTTLLYMARSYSSSVSIIYEYELGLESWTTSPFTRLIRALYVTRTIWRIFSLERKVFPFHSSPVIIQSCYKYVIKWISNIDIVDCVSQSSKSTRALINMTKQVFILLNTDIFVPFLISWAGLPWVSLYQKGLEKCLTMLLSGTVFFNPYKSACMLNTNCSTNQLIHRNICWRHWEEAPRNDHEISSRRH